MDKEQLIWDHFKLNSDQRLKAFNFYVVLSIFADGGVFAALEKNIAPQFLSILGILVSALSVIFWLIDSRSRNLLLLTIPAIKDIESSFPEKYQLFALDEKQRGGMVRYTFAIRALFVCQLIFGLGITVYSLIKWLC